jgi:hypothetical protein
VQKIIWRLVFCGVLLFTGYTFGLASKNPLSAEQKKVEYKVLGVKQLLKLETFEAKLNKIGLQGWELVQFDKSIAIFKRQAKP